MSPIKILHASDLHISVNEGSRSGTDWLHDLYNAGPSWKSKIALVKAWEKIGTISSHNVQILEDLTEFACKHEKRFDGENVKSGCIDAVLLTGDLATTGDEKDIKLMYAFLEGPSTKKPWHTIDQTDQNRGFPTLGALKIPVGVLPGNHDRLEKTSLTWRVRDWFNVPDIGKFYLPAGKFFDTYMEKLTVNPMKSFTTNPVQKMKELRMPISGGRTLVVHILLADLTLKDYGPDHHEGHWYGWIGQGRAYPERCDMLVKETDEIVRESEAAGKLRFGRGRQSRRGRAAVACPGHRGGAHPRAPDI
jgi:hypothetical protein